MKLLLPLAALAGALSLLIDGWSSTVLNYL
jgi:hypothetical protein